jgi:tetratricopeptide (TPR) repeat protein
MKRTFKLFSIFLVVALTACTTTLTQTGSTVSNANDWISSIDKKYLAKNSELFSQFDQVRELLNSWGGQREKLQQADSILRKILKQDPKYAPAYREYGRLYIMAGYVNYDKFQEGSLDPSEQSILKSLEIEPEYADSYVLLGHLYTVMKRYNEAHASLQKAEEIGTETPWLQLNWADLHKHLREYDAAMKRFQFVVKKGTSNRKAYANALSGVTTMHIYFNEYSEANNGYKRQLEYSPDDAWTWGNYSSFLLFSYKDVDGAIKKGRKAIQIMNYGMGRFILSCSLYTKWAILKDNPITTLQAQEYFDEAWSIYPYPEKVIEKMKKYSHTRITADALKEWLTSKDT